MKKRFRELRRRLWCWLCLVRDGQWFSIGYEVSMGDNSLTLYWDWGWEKTWMTLDQKTGVWQYYALYRGRFEDV